MEKQARLKKIGNGSYIFSCSFYYCRNDKKSKVNRTETKLHAESQIESM